LVVTIGILVGIAISLPANAGTLRQNSTGATVTGARPGQVLWTDYADFSPIDVDSEFFGNDTIIRLINPNGSANPGISGEGEHTVCAMIYVFDDDEEMEECCGCPISSAGLLSFSVDHNLQSNGVFNDDNDLYTGIISFVAAAPNGDITTFGRPSNGHGCTLGQSGACNFGCDPTSHPGYDVTTDNNLLGSRTYNFGYFDAGPRGLTETALFDDGAGDPNNLTYLKAECGLLVGNGSGAGICSCPAPFAAPID